jgi:hypothetical protein
MYRTTAAVGLTALLLGETVAPAKSPLERRKEVEAADIAFLWPS